MITRRPGPDAGPDPFLPQPNRHGRRRPTQEAGPGLRAEDPRVVREESGLGAVDAPQFVQGA